MSLDSEPWCFLESTSDACAVVRTGMEVVYLNAPAKSLVPSDWFGKHCWQVFPVADQTCAARCPAVRAVNGSGQLAYCEETICPAKSLPVTLGVVVIPLPSPRGERMGAILLMRPKPKPGPGKENARFRAQLMEDAQKLYDLSLLGKE